MLEFNNERLIEYLQFMKLQIYTLQQQRMGYYCSLCNGEEQKYFLVTQKYVQVSEQFCFDLLKNSKDLIMFQNVVLIEYLEFIYEIRNCYEGNPEKMEQDKILTKYKRRIPLIKTCFQNMGETLDQNFVKNCWFLCQGFKFN